MSEMWFGERLSNYSCKGLKEKHPEIEEFDIQHYKKLDEQEFEDNVASFLSLKSL